MARENDEVIGDYVRRLFTELHARYKSEKKTQKHLGDELGIDQSHVSQLKIVGRASDRVILDGTRIAGWDMKAASRMLGLDEIVEQASADPFAQARSFFLANLSQKGESEQAEAFLARFLQNEQRGAENMTSGEWYEHLTMMYRGWKLGHSDKDKSTKAKPPGRPL